MTYKEAVKIIDESRKQLDINVLHVNPVHRVLGTFIAPEQSSSNTHEHIFEQCVKQHKSNEDVLFELNMFSTDLIPFVVILMKGNNIVMPLESYLSNPLLNDEGK